MKFDFAIGNPPYQEQSDTNGRQPPVYNLFMDEAYKVANCVELITPARFLFNAGQTPKSWNEKMLNDEHFKVLQYESDASKVFANTDIKGGVTITLRNQDKVFGKIGIFTQNNSVELILNKVLPYCKKSIKDICIGAVPYRFTETLRIEHPEYVDLAGDSFDLRINTLDNLGNKIFFEKKPDNSDYVQIVGLYNKKRTTMFVESKFIEGPENFNKYKLLLSKANGSGKFGEALSQPILVGSGIGHTQSFISIGKFDTKQEAENLEKYIKTKFARCLLSILRTTPDTTPYKWKYVPLLNFVSEVGIDWSKTVDEISHELYD
ncbi:MAG: Eco57I restriction-modification methylase domain-containing protein, partial [Methanobrevibacter sp.]|nr:Eco57I restriction-modification methylase domain-containing protein [Methanobrevibacter sp.]